MQAITVIYSVIDQRQVARDPRLIGDAARPFLALRTTSSAVVGGQDCTRVLGRYSTSKSARARVASARKGAADD